MSKRSLTSTMASFRRTGARLLRMTSRLLKQPAKRKKTAGATTARAPTFSPNPGGLVMHSHVPANLRPKAPLVVLLHGCGQAPDSFAIDTGWRRLADQFGIALLMPGQVAANNSQLCFNWFRPADTGRDLGEAASIIAMTHAMIRRHRCDPARVFITGLSAGGAMTACLLAAYPDLFAAGAVVAGLPAGSATGVVAAMTRMAGRGKDLSAADWLTRARSLAPLAYAGPWPRLSIWHGDADTTVAPINATQLALQWTTLNGLDTPAVHRNVAPGITCDVWGNPARPTIELWRIAGMGHVYPADNATIAAAPSIARFWGLLA